MATADGDFKIRVEVPGESFKSLADLESWLKRERKAVKELDTASQEFANRSKQLSGVLDEKTRISKAMWSTNAKMKDSYFRLGEEIRRKTLPLMGNLNSLAMSTQGGIRGMANAAVMSVSSFSRLSGQVGGLGNAFKAMGGMLLGPGGIILAISALALAFGDELIPNIETATERLEKLTKALQDAAKEGFAGVDEERTRKELDTYEERARIAMEQEAELKREISELAGKVDYQFGLPMPTDEELTKINTRLTKAREELMYLEKFRLAQEEYAKAARAALGVLEQQEAVRLRARGDIDLTAQGQRQFAAGDSSIPIPADRGARKPTKVDADFIPKMPAIVADIGIEWDTLVSSMLTGVSAVGQAVSTGIGDAFARSFAGANSLFEIFLVNVLQGIAEIATRWAVMQALSFIPGIGPVLAAFAPKAAGGPVSSGRGYIVGERGPEIFVPNQSGMIVPNHAMQGPIVLETVIRGNDLVLVQAKASRQRSGRTM